jgi:HEAT repeat protein
LTHASGICLLALSALAAGCTSREVTLQRLRTDNPRVQAATIAQVARAGDRSMVPELIDLLDAQDEGVRFMAAAGLHQVTGQDFGSHFARRDERQAVIDKWRQWWEAQQKADSRPQPG